LCVVTVIIVVVLTMIFRICTSVRNIIVCDSVCVCEREKCVGVCMHVPQEIILIILIWGGYD